MIFVSFSSLSQEVYDLNLKDEYSTNGNRINLTENFVVKNIQSNNLLNSLEAYCDNLRLSLQEKYLNHTYVFYKFKQGVLDNNISVSFENLHTNKNKMIAILRYHQKSDGNEEKLFILLENGIPVKCLIDGIEKAKLR